MEDIILIIHSLAAAAVIGLVMMQHGKGADAGASFGGGGSGSLFGVSGSSNLLSRLTALFIAVFFCTSLVLGYMASNRQTSSVVKSQTQVAPAVTETSKSAEPSTDDIPK